MRYLLLAQTNNKRNKAQRQGWVKALREGKNPFTKEELEKLLHEDLDGAEWMGRTLRVNKARPRT